MKKELNFLDITIKNNCRKGSYDFTVHKSFDKRKEFNFQIIRYPYLSGNVPLYPSVGVFTSQQINYSINLIVVDFKNDIIHLVNNSQRYDLNMLKLKYIQFGHILVSILLD